MTISDLMFTTQAPVITTTEPMGIAYINGSKQLHPHAIMYRNIILSVNVICRLQFTDVRRVH